MGGLAGRPPVRAVVAQSDPETCGLAWAAKVVCSGVHVTGRQAAEVLRNSSAWMAAPDELVRRALEDRDPLPLLGLEIVEHPALKAVTLRNARGAEAHARFFEGVGSVVVPAPGAMPDFDPRAVRAAPLEDPSLPWPEGEALAGGARALSGRARERLERGVEMLFADPRQLTNAVVAVHGGRIVAERYAEGFDPASMFESWSMGKSIAATCVGLLEARGLLSLEEDGLFDAWSGPGDPRRAIRVRDLLNMASGLRFSGSYTRGEDHSVKQRDGRFLDHIYVYGGGVDSEAFCLGKPLEHPPGTRGAYRNCDPILAMCLVRRRLGLARDDFRHWPQRALFDRLGATGMLLEVDPAGNFLVSGHNYGRARDWARLGLLYLNRGRCAGRKLLSEGFVDFVSTPAVSAWRDDPYYGGLFVTNNTGMVPTLPPDAYWMSGGGRQRVFVIPSLELVVVRMGHMAGEIFGLQRTMDDALGAVAAAFG